MNFSSGTKNNQITLIEKRKREIKGGNCGACVTNRVYFDKTVNLAALKLSKAVKMIALVNVYKTWA